MQTSSSALLEEVTVLAECFERIVAGKDRTRPDATYRLQFNKDFRFSEARRLIPYLQQLGISHCYASPILMAREGSAHGYDITDHNCINPEIGTEEEFRELALELRRNGMGLILDVVPNHMGVGYGHNAWWQDLLQNGRTSTYADYFDIDWEPLKDELEGKVLLPVLGNTYGDDLEDGKIQLKFDRGIFSVGYHGRELPIDPQTIPLIFTAAERWPDDQGAGERAELRALQSLLRKMQDLPPNDTAEPEEAKRRQSEVPALMQELRQLSGHSAIARLIEERVRVINGTPGKSASFDALHRLLDAQAYRLAFWRVSGEEINYRRFFDINDLVGLRMEDPRVFADTHRLIRELLADELICGVRIDHPDGLLNPLQYYTRLQMLYVAGRCCGRNPQPPLAQNGIELEIQTAFGQDPAVASAAPLYILVEKILEQGEDLPEEWPVDGTVGYDFANLVNGILIDRRSEQSFTKLYHRILGSTVDVDMLVYDSKKLIMNSALSSEVNVLSHMLDRISIQDRRARDFTLNVLRRAIREVIACFPVYRTYIDERGNVTERDRRYIEEAIEHAKRRNGNIAGAVFDFLRNILLLRGADGGEPMHGYRRQLYFTLKFQQLTGPVMAKGLEDTACYVYNRFVSVNEVGGSPAEFGFSLEQFHRANEVRAAKWPSSMLASSTHDTKRSEDVRARLDVLSEMPRNWAALVMKWRRINRSRKVKLSDGRLVPDNNEEYLLYQTIVGTWPIRMYGPEQRGQYIARIQRYMEKAVHEAKVNLSWLNPNPEYVAGLNSFIEKILTPEAGRRSNLFLDSLQKLLPAITFFGSMNSLSQSLLKLTLPGVPDIYQGQELWDFSLVDPDNRQPVDFELRIRYLRELTQREPSADIGDLPLELMRRYEDGRAKLWTLMRVLNFRRAHQQLFRRGSYIPLRAMPDRDEHVVAFARTLGDETILVAAPRLSYILMRGNLQPPVGAAWGETELPIPSTLQSSTLHNALTGEEVGARNGRLLCREVFARFPLALLTV